MTPFALNLALPVAQAVGALCVYRRTRLNHPALMSYLVTEAGWRTLSLAGVPVSTGITLTQVVTHTALVFETVSLSRIHASNEVRAAGVGLAMSGCAMMAGSAQGLSAAQGLFLFREYYHLFLCSALGAAGVYRWFRPVLECLRHRIYAGAVALWLAVITIASSFVRGGLAYEVFPYGKPTWDAVNVWTLAARIVTIGAMAAALAVVLPHRRTAAKVGDVWIAKRLKLAA